MTEEKRHEYARELRRIAEQYADLCNRSPDVITESVACIAGTAALERVAELEAKVSDLKSEVLDLEDEIYRLRERADDLERAAEVVSRF